MTRNIIIIHKGEVYECWGSLTEICKNHTEMKYHSLKTKEYPFESNGWTFRKLKYNQRSK